MDFLDTFAKKRSKKFLASLKRPADWRSACNFSRLLVLLLWRFFTRLFQSISPLESYPEAGQSKAVQMSNV
jgi:hypothetical protein